MEKIKEMFPDFEDKIYLYISGSQGVSPNTLVVHRRDFNSLEELEGIFLSFIDDNAYDNIDSYLDDCDGDEDEAMNEAVCDSGSFLLGTSEDNYTYEYTLGTFEKIVNIE